MEVSARELLGGMEGSEWDALLGGLSPTQLGQVGLPRFTLTYDGWLNDVLMEIGMGVAFGPGADFTRMSPLGDQLCITHVRQKAFIEVDERGTRAAAATTVGIGLESAPPSVVVDRPFIFAIRERLSGTLLFAGLVGDPAAEDPGPESPTVLCS
jgi:serine protease inhibitor